MDNKRTDTERLDWIERERADLEFVRTGWAVTFGEFVTHAAQTPRDAIDEAMRRAGR